MPLGTLDSTPPPFFRQGPSALTKVVFFAALALFLMVADARLRLAQPLREALAFVLLPVQRALATPVELVFGGAQYLQGLDAAREAERRAREQLALGAEQVARAGALAAENERLRALLELKPAITARSQAAEVLYDAPDLFTRKVVIDRGQSHGVVAGSPVIDPDGVLGQVTRVYALTSEVTLLVDKDAAIPVLNARTRQRGAAFGLSGTMELRFTSPNADVRPGDLLQTSGVDGVYPPGLPVAKVMSVERRSDSGFARIALAPTANSDGVRHVLVLEPLAAQLPPKPEAAPAAPEVARRPGSGRP